MSINVPNEVTASERRAMPGGGSAGFLHAMALSAVVVGALGSVGLMLWVGHRNPSRLLLVLFTIWVLAPFMVLLVANMASKRWSIITRVTLHILTLVLALCSLAIYADVVLRPPRSTPAFMFVVVPLGSWLLMAIVVPIAALISGREGGKSNS